MSRGMSEIWKQFRRGGQAKAPPVAPAIRYTVHIDDNFHYMDEEQRVAAGAHDDLDSAVSACKRIVDRSLLHEYRPGMTADQLYGQYTSFGDDPFIRPAPPGTVLFSAWTYARQRCDEICSAGAAASAPLGGDICTAGAGRCMVASASCARAPGCATGGCVPCGPTLLTKSREGVVLGQMTRYHVPEPGSPLMDTLVFGF